MVVLRRLGPSPWGASVRVPGTRIVHCTGLAMTAAGGWRQALAGVAPMSPRKCLRTWHSRSTRPRQIGAGNRPFPCLKGTQARRRLRRAIASPANPSPASASAEGSGTDCGGGAVAV